MAGVDWAIRCHNCAGVGAYEDDCERRVGCNDCGGSGVEPPHKKAERLDNLAIAQFTRVLRDKMATNRLKGRDGWQTCTPDALWNMLREHVEKGDPRDVALLAMMIWHNTTQQQGAGGDER